jgi:threonine dehydrogenase-like Zn-dependent dehydrogenase
MAYLPDEFDTVMEYIAQKRMDVEKMVTGTTDLTGLGSAFERLASGKSEDIKIVCREGILVWKV